MLSHLRESGELEAVADVVLLLYREEYYDLEKAQREGKADEPIPGADAEAKSEVVLVLPDNSRDPELMQVLRAAQDKYFARKLQPAELRA